MEDPYLLITKYLDGKTNPDENIIFDSWKNESKDNEQLFNELKDTWELIQYSQNDKVIPDKKRLWNRIIKKIDFPPIMHMYSRATLIRITGIVALVALIIAFSIAWIFPLKKDLAVSDVTITTPKGQKSQVLLPDSTFVSLNSGSTLTYSTAFNNTTNRRVKLSGEAFFQVNKNTQSKFEVYTNQVKLLVDKTSFNVRAYENDDDMEVSLIQGDVRLLAKSTDAPLANMKSGEKARISRQTLSCSVLPDDFQTGKKQKFNPLKIDGEPLANAFLKIEQQYGINIRTPDDKDNQETYWLTIRTESLLEILELINKITPIDCTIKGEEVDITYNK